MLSIPTIFQLLSICCTPALSLAVQRDSSSSSPLTVSQLASIAPTSTTCDGAPYPAECRTASQALPHILQSFNVYQINSIGAQAAILSTIAFESGDFKYQKNYFPGNPGQGTRNMQSSTFNLQYARSIPSLANRLADAQAAGPNGIRDLLIGDDDIDFGSAAWFLNSQCGGQVKLALAQMSVEAFQQYLGCIGTSPNGGRTAYWQRAVAALSAA